METNTQNSVTLTTATFDSDGYVTDETLEAIKDWLDGDWQGLWKLIESAWNTKFGGIRRASTTTSLITGGWSGNEEVISAMQENLIFWSIFWLRSERGGLFVFDTKSV